MVLGGIETVCAAVIAAYASRLIKNKVRSYFKNKAAQKQATLDKVKEEDQVKAEKKRLGDIKAQEEIKKNPPSIIPWSDFRKNFTCPKCGLNWCYAEKTNTGPAYCKCDVHASGHFHLNCNGNVNNTANVGCKANIIMLSKDSKEHDEK